MKSLLFRLISTRSGWAVRQLLKATTTASASLASVLVTQGAPATSAETMAAGATAALAWGIETGLSRLARHIATP